VSELSGQGAEIARVFVQPAEQRRKAARDITQLIRSACLRKRRDQALARQGSVAQREPSLAGLGDPQLPDGLLMLLVVDGCRRVDGAMRLGLIEQATIET